MGVRLSRQGDYGTTDIGEGEIKIWVYKYLKLGRVSQQVQQVGVVCGGRGWR